MNLTPHNRELLRQRMDACRPGSDDLLLPEMSELAAALRADALLREEWESRQRSEHLIAAAMHELSVPAGLTERILAAAAAKDRAPLAEATDQAIAAVADPAAAVVPQRVQRGGLLSRRQWTWIGGAALLLVAAAVIWKLQPPSPAEVSREQLASSAERWFYDAVKHTDALRSGEPPVRFPVEAIPRPVLGWRYLPAPEERSLVAFDLTNIQSGGRVFLFAAKTTKKYQVGELPYTQVQASGGLEVGAWQQQDVVYVLVVDSKGRLHLPEVLKRPKLA